MTHGRTRFWVGLLALCGALVALAPPRVGERGAAGVVQSTPRPSGADATRTDVRQRPSAGREPSTVLRIVPREADADAADDGSGLWLAAEVPAPVAASPPRTAPTVATPVVPTPMAPALPFRLIGRYFDADRAGVVLQGADGEVLVVHAGDTLGAQYRVDAIAGNTLMLTYVPLNLPQSMDIGIAVGTSQ